jgi:hypothetical protein
MLVGGRYVCVRCRCRGPAASCPSCGRERLDLNDAEGLAELHRTWTMAEAWRRGTSIVSPLAVRWNRPLLRVSLVLASLTLVGALVANLLHTSRGGAPDAASLLAGVLVSIVASVLFAGPLTAFYALYIFYAGHVFRLLAMVLGGLLALSPFGRDRLTVLGVLASFLSELVLPILVPDDRVKPPGASRTGTLVAPLVVRRASDGWGWLPSTDAWLDAIELREGDGDGDRIVTLHPTSAHLVWSLDTVSLANAADHWLLAGTTRLSPQEGAPAAPIWIDNHGRLREVRATTVPAGTRVTFAGGVSVEGGVRGTGAAPLDVEIG